MADRPAVRNPLFIAAAAQLLKVLIALLFSTVTTQASSIQDLVNQYADRHGVPRNIAHAVVKVESNYRANIRGKDGEYGLGQIMCPTARGEGFKGDCSQLFDPATNLNFSMSYLAKALSGGGDLCGKLSRYNFGIHRAAFCTAYGQRVIANIGK